MVVKVTLFFDLIFQLRCFKSEASTLSRNDMIEISLLGMRSPLLLWKNEMKTLLMDIQLWVVCCS